VTLSPRIPSLCGSGLGLATREFMWDLEGRSKMQPFKGAQKAMQGSPQCMLLLVVWFFFETMFCYVAQAGLEVRILLPQPPKCWDYGCVPLCLL
jgi:hypothetical protein